VAILLWDNPVGENPSSLPLVAMTEKASGSAPFHGQGRLQR